MLAAAVMMAIGAAGYLLLLEAYPVRQTGSDRIAYSRVLLDKEGRLLRAYLSADRQWALPVTLEELNPHLINATIAVEDQRFRSHHGVDPIAVARAMISNVAGQKVVSGASTLTMQAVRLLHPRTRSIETKLVEAAHALELETRSGKDEILRLYFDLAPYGGNIRGVKAASYRYFNKLPADLTLSQSAMLAGLPQSPNRLRPDRFPDRARKRRDHVLSRMYEEGYITSEQFQDGVAEPLYTRTYPFPFRAPHFCQLSVEEARNSGTVTTTLDPHIQAQAEASLRAAVGELRLAGVTNGAVVVIENKTGKVRALAGSADFHSVDDQGQVNGAVSRRSPGSALKPFTYALGLAEGEITGMTVLADVPRHFHGYEPRNFDLRFRGPVRAGDALVQSLNVPAVEILARFGVEKLHRSLVKMGLSTLTRGPSDYGLALTLGAAEVTLLELTNAYAALARLGSFRPYALVEHPGLSEDARSVLPAGAAYLVAETLAAPGRSLKGGYFRDPHLAPKVAWKTGTSSGHRDAWTIAYNPDYSVGVWMGNFSGESSPALVGLTSAAPVALKLFDWLYQGKSAPWYDPPDGVEERQVCSLSGMVAGPNCPHLVHDSYLAGLSSDLPCDVHRTLEIADLPAEVQARLAVEPPMDRLVVEVWPNALHSWLSTHDAGYTGLAEWMVETTDIVDRERLKPQIISPHDQAEYVASATTAQAALSLQAYGAHDTDKLFWFVDGMLHGTVPVGEKLLWVPQPGIHRIACSDVHGRSSKVTVTIL